MAKTPDQKRPPVVPQPSPAIGQDSPLLNRGPAGPAVRPVVLAGLIALVCAVALAVHWPVLSSQAICFDDEFYLFGNSVLQTPSWASAGRCLTDIFHSSTVEGYYEPLTLISLMLDVAAGGQRGDLQPFHTTSLILHLLNTALVIALIYLLFRDALVAMLVGLVFSLHPLTVEPIAWVWERKTPLAMCFALACLVTYAGYVRRERSWLYALSLLMLLLSLLSKPTAVFLPAGLVLIDIWPLRRFSAKTLLEKIPFFALSAAAACITVISTAGNASVSMPRSLSSIVLQMLWLTGFYPAKVAWPEGLSPAYVLPSPLALSNPFVLSAVIAVAVGCIVLVASWRWSRAPLIGWLFFMLLLFPTLGVIRYSWVVASDKYVYMPAIGLLLLLAAGLVWLRGRLAGRSARAVTGILVVAMLPVAVAEAVTTRIQIAHWRDSETLARRMVTLAPESAKAWSRLGNALSDRGELGEAIKCYINALERDPSLAEVHFNLAVTLASANMFDQAIAQYQAAIALDANSIRAHNNLANLLVRRGRAAEALTHLDAVLKTRFDTPEPHYNRANALLALNRVDEAIRELELAAQYAPSHVATHLRLAKTLEKAGRQQEALKEYQRVLELNPQHAEAQKRLRELAKGTPASGTTPAAGPSTRAAG